MCSENWYCQHIPRWTPFIPSYVHTDQYYPSMIMDKKREKINYIAYLLVHKSTSAKDEDR
jgi:hypothetical protein